MRRLLAAARGGGSFSRPGAGSFDVSGPYDPALTVNATVLTQLHCHTTGSSDADYTPAEVVAFYLAAGYGALQITDHDVVTAQPNGITTKITGNELSPIENHIIAINANYTRGATTDAQTIIDGIKAAGGEAHIAHPKWLAGMSHAEMVALTDYLGLEIHNNIVVGGAGQDPVALPGFALDRWDALLAAGNKATWAFSVDDLHWLDAFTTYDVGRVQVFVETNNVAGVVARLVSGAFVADVSNYGVTPGYPVRSAEGVSLACTGAVRIEAWNASGLIAAAAGSSLDYSFVGTEEYVRLVAVGDYTEPFSAALGNQWAAVDGSWVVSGGVLSLNDASVRRIILRRHREGDFEARVDVRITTSGDAFAALLFNVLNSDYYYTLRFGEAGAATDYHNKLTVAKTTNNSFSGVTPLGSHDITPASDTWYTLRMSYESGTGRIRAKVWERADPEPDWQIDVTDTTWTDGGFGLRAIQTPQFDNLYISGFRTYYQPIAIDPA